METATTTHETRARAAKAQALATVLAEIPSITTAVDVHQLTDEQWAMAAQAATLRCLLGVNAAGEAVTVHPPHSADTVRAVAHVLELRAQRFIAKPLPSGRVWQVRDTQGRELQYNGQPTASVTWDGMTREAAERIASRYNAGWRPTEARHPRDSQGYRARMAELAPVPETTEADLFAPFRGFPR